MNYNEAFDTLKNTVRNMYLIIMMNLITATGKNC